MTDELRPSDRVVEQRVRNRVIEYLELAASFHAQRDYQAAVPRVNIPYEVINQWQDWVHDDPPDPANLSAVYTPDEARAMQQFHSVWDRAADALPDTFPTLADAQAMPEWEVLRRCAANALTVFARRGRMSEDEEEHR